VPEISVILPTRNPHRGRLRRTLDALAAQSLSSTAWELVIVDNGSSPPLVVSDLASVSGRIVREDTPGLTRARLCGLRETRAPLIVFVDDDNELSPRFLERVCALFAQHPGLGAAGGPVHPEFETPPSAWAAEFYGLLALRDLGPEPLLTRGGSAVPWPNSAPVGAGLCLRRAASVPYVEALARDGERMAFDRTDRSLASGGDNDLVFTALHAGWDVGYFPELSLTHLIPSGRLDADYLTRLNRGIMRSWVGVLALHGQCPWPSIARWTVPLRSARAWWRFRAWQSPAHRIRWSGAVGQFEGQADLSSAAGHR
jgi:glycosyltransferase involved in cell wall biosynthesis